MPASMIQMFATPQWICAGLLGNCAATWFMVGVIVFVQIVHYPLFSDIGRHGFSHYASRHQILTTWVVGVPMVAEALFSCVFMVWLSTAEGTARLDGSTVFLNVGIEMLILVVTAVFSIPCHAALAQGFDQRVVKRLVWTNWLRTFAWLCKGWIATVMLAKNLI